MPLIPVTCRGSEVSSPSRRLQTLRDGSHYRRARLLVKLLFAAEALSGVVGVIVVVATRRTSSPLLAGTLCALVIALSFVAAELAAAVFDVADAAVELKFRSSVLPGPQR